jgi:predicted dehydrogenase
MSIDSASPTGDSPLRLGVIGCGRIAQVAHLPALAKAESITLAGVSDRSPALAKGVGARYGVPGFTDVSDLLAQDIEAVLIAVPDRFHLAVGTEALTAGKHILLEKPAASTSAEAAELARLAADRGLKVQIGAMRRHDPGINYARRAVAQIGPVLSVTGWYRVHSKLRPPTEQTLFPYTVVDEDVRKHEAEFKADRQRYLLATHGAHVFDTLRYLAGDVAAVQARVAHVGADFSWHGSGRLAEGGLASFEISANVHSDYAEGFDIYGERGHVSVRAYFPFFRRASSVRVFTEEDATWRSPEFGAADSYQRQAEAFAAAIRTGDATDPSAEDGVQALRLIEAVTASAAGSGAEVTP